jgi:adenosylcobinamide kinase / adenosylcobinamide-phosphate guanylyltransferase
VKRTILLLGGARSGKSTYAQKLAEQMGGRVLFTATATAGDEDMRLRIEKHKRERPASWNTLEAPLKIGTRITEVLKDENTVVIDCLTLLVNNVFCRTGDEEFDNIDGAILEEEVISEIGELIECIKKTDISFIIVSNEVGLGLVPDNRMGRLYRDILGRANQMIAQSVDEVYFMAAGIPLKIKP